MDDDERNAIGRIPILVSNSGVPCVSSRSRAIPYSNERMHRVRVCDATAVKLHDVTFVVVEARERDTTYSLVADCVAWAPRFLVPREGGGTPVVMVQ